MVALDLSPLSLSALMSNQPAKPRNRRLAMRREPKRSSKITFRKGVLGLGPNHALTMLDLSESGVRLLSKTEVKVGEDVEVGLLPPGGAREVVRKGRVIWVVPTAEGTFCVGVEFAKRLDYSALLDLSRTT